MSVAGGMVAFAQQLRRAGVAADTARTATALEALATLDPLDIEQVYWAGRLTLLAEPDDLARYDAVFQLCFCDRLPPDAGPATMAVMRAIPLGTDDASDPPAADRPDDDTPPLQTSASEVEILRHRDLADLDVAALEHVHELIAALRPRTAARRTVRRAPRGRERIDRRRTVRAMLQTGEPARLHRDHRRTQPRPLVLLLDVSGSMTPYADAVLRFGHAAVSTTPSATEVFTIGTRLTRITPALRRRDSRQALEAAALAIPDWSGGTRIGEALQAFLDRWGQRGTARGAVVVVFSDGWERGDATLLGTQMARLARLAHRVVWVHPHRGKDGFAPITGGMVAARPHVEDVVAGHTVAALAEVAEVIGRA